MLFWLQASVLSNFIWSYLYALQLDAEIADCSEARERERPLVEEVEVKVKELRQTIPSLNNQQMSLRASFRKMKEKVTEMDEKVRCWHTSTYYFSSA